MNSYDILIVKAHTIFFSYIVPAYVNYVWQSTHQVDFPQVSDGKYCGCVPILILHITKVLELDSMPLVITIFLHTFTWCSKAMLLSSCITSNIHTSMILYLILLELFWPCVQLLFIICFGPCQKLDNHEFLYKYMLYAVFIYMYIHPVWALYFFKTGLKYFKCWHLCKTLLILIFFFSPAQLTR